MRSCGICDTQWLHEEIVMPATSKSARVCETCGSPIETTSAGDLGCINCLLGAGLDVEGKQTEGAFGPTLDQLGAYTIEHHADGSVWELGRGAMGVTYRAIDKALDRRVALKIINTDHGSRSGEARERFMREARAAAALRHPNVATVYQFGVREETGQFFYAMELVEGETLEQRVRRLGPLDVITTIDIALQVTAALEAAEERGLVHRDLKPGNLMLLKAAPSPHSSSSDNATRASRRQVKVIDFGVAKAVVEKTNAMVLTHGGFVGTPAFASPEQFTNAPVDVRSDIYSLGATIWFLLTGHMLFSGRTIEEIQDTRQSKPLPIDQLKAARVPRRFVSLLISMLAIEPAARPAGARELTQKLQAIRASISGRGKTAMRLTLAAAIVALATFVATRVFHPTKAMPSPIHEKSIAVLPFENLSVDPGNAYFAEGIQEEIVTRLAKIADLKVISRSSTQRYHNKPGNLAEIARQLGVTNIVQGSVQKAADQVRVNVQLINAQTDSHLWAESYDRKLTDIFAVESDISKGIAESLQAKLTGREERALAVRPTSNPDAYNAYLRGLVYTLKASSATPANALSAQKYLREAVRLDPEFALAWALLSFVDGQGYLNQHLQPTVALREEAAQAAHTALTLEPNLGEAVVAKGYYYYACLRDYDSAVRYFKEARRLLPNSSWLSELLAKVARRRGQWAESESHFNEAERLDPRNASVLVQHALSYSCLRHFPDALLKLDQALNITPDDVSTVGNKASIAQAEGDLPRAAALLATLRPNADDPNALETQVYQAILERQPAPIASRLKEILANPNPALGYLNGELRFWLGWAQELAGDPAAAQESWRLARSELEPLLKEQPDNYNVVGNLALINAGLGDKPAAFAWAEQATAVLPIERDATSGAIPIEILARVAAQMGEPDRAIAGLRTLLSIPYEGAFEKGVPLTPALLRLDPMFDALRSDPRFQKLCEQKQPIALK
jgi:serine/threonine protein kinase/Tfp pilus assembly protein PilF